MNTDIHHPNDSLFKKSMSDIRVATDFFQSHLPAKLLERIDLSRLQLENKSFISAHHHKSESDIIYSVKTVDKSTTYFYLLCEQQTTVDKNMPFRLLKYQIRLMEQHLEQHRGSDLPIVYPMVLYSGEKSWKKPKTIFPYFGEQAELAKSLWGSPFQLIDLHRIEDEEMRERLWSGLMEFSLKYKRVRHFREFLRTLLPWIDAIWVEAGDEFGKLVLHYILRNVDKTDKRIFIEETEHHDNSTRRETMTLAEQFREEGRKEVMERAMKQAQKKTMTLAEQFREEGLQKGLENGRTVAVKEVAIKMLHNDMPIAVIVRLTGLSLEEINKLQEECALT